MTVDKYALYVITKLVTTRDAAKLWDVDAYFDIINVAWTVNHLLM